MVNRDLREVEEQLHANFSSTEKKILNLGNPMIRRSEFKRWERSVNPDRPFLRLPNETIRQLNQNKPLTKDACEKRSDEWS